MGLSHQEVYKSASRAETHRLLKLNNSRKIYLVRNYLQRCADGVGTEDSIAYLLPVLARDDKGIN